VAEEPVERVVGAARLVSPSRRPVEPLVHGPTGRPRRARPSTCVSSGAGDTAQNITSWLARWTAKPLRPTAIAEQAGQLALYPGPNMKW
jgi:hypothetical protein